MKVKRKVLEIKEINKTLSSSNHAVDRIHHIYEDRNENLTKHQVNQVIKKIQSYIDSEKQNVTVLRRRKRNNEGKHTSFKSVSVDSDKVVKQKRKQTNPRRLREIAGKKK